MKLLLAGVAMGCGVVEVVLCSCTTVLGGSGFGGAVSLATVRRRYAAAVRLQSAIDVASAELTRPAAAEGLAFRRDPRFQVRCRRRCESPPGRVAFGGRVASTTTLVCANGLQFRTYLAWQPSVCANPSCCDRGVYMGVSRLVLHTTSNTTSNRCRLQIKLYWRS